MNAYLLTVGDEILIGQVVDTNSSWMAQELNDIGCHIVEKASVADEHQPIMEALHHAFKKADIILMTGGLGPTKDDITKKVLADFFGVGMVFSEVTYTRIQRFFERMDRPVREAHRLQCYMPANAELLTNTLGTAPGMLFSNNTNKMLVSMPGVPYEMKQIMKDEVLPRLKSTFKTQPIAHRTLLTAGHGETHIAEKLGQFESALPSFLKLSYLPNLGQVRLRLTGKYHDERQLNYHLDRHVKEIEALLPGWIFGRETETLEEVVGKSLTKKGLTIGTAESCTGGNIAARLVSIPGASHYYQGSVIAYANRMKILELSVSPKTIQEYGAVSEQTVRSMVRGALTKLDVDIAVAISGIAGPSGGSPDKPVGTVFVAVGDKNRQEVHHLKLGTDRSKNIEYATNYALYMTWQFLEGYL